MIKKLHKNIVLAGTLLLGIAQMNAQGPYTFSTASLDSWTSGFGSAAGITHESSEGISGDGALKLVRTNNNSNIGYNQGFDADTYKFIKIRYKNTTSATSFRVQGSQDVENTIQITPTVFPMSSNMTEYTVTYLDMTGVTNWSGTVLNLDILVRVNYGDTDETGGILFDEIELVSSVPPTQYSEYIKNPSFDGPSGIDHLTGGKEFVTRGLTYTEFHDGDQSLKLNFTGNADAPFWTFSNYEKVYGSPFSAGSDFQVKMWVKTNRTTPIKLSGRVKLTNGGVDTATKPIASVVTTNTAMEWEELTFNIEAAEDFDGVTFWFAVDYTEGESINLLSGDVVYIDQITATVTEGTLSSSKNTLEGASVSVSNNAIHIVAPTGSQSNVYAITGALVATSNQASIDTSSFNSGVYFVKVSNGGKVFAKKVLIE